jgi:hypothetical protein
LAFLHTYPILILTLGVNNSTVCTNINDIHYNKNISVQEENTPGEVNIKIKLLEESVDSYPLNLQTENLEKSRESIRSDTVTPILRLRGGLGDEEKEEMVEETVGERFILTTLDKD